LNKTRSIRVGPAGWSYKDWEGIVYPPHGSKFDHLAYLAEFFDTIEVNSSFYRTPPATHAKSWVRRVAFNPEFLFTAKLAQEFTHARDFPSADEVALFRQFLEPLQSEEKLGAVLAQFPWSFKDSRGSRERLRRIFEALKGVPLVVEMRHGSFQTEEFLLFLRDNGVGFANIDQPIFGNSVRPSAVVTSDVAYVRFHGRNYEKWFEHEESWERYNYLYSDKELDEWVPRIESMHSGGAQVFVVTNNHFRGQAIQNAGELKKKLGQASRLPGGMGG